MSHSLKVVREGNGVGPMGSVHVSSNIFPIESSRFFTSPTSVFSSPIFKWTAFLLNRIHNRDDLEDIPFSSNLFKFCQLCQAYRKIL